MRESDELVGVTPAGAVLLGPDVVCDGFYVDANVRAQSHIHADHLEGFEASKGHQEVAISVPSFDLLVLSKNADLPYRSNIHALQYSAWNTYGNSRVMLVPSHHMLGASQVLVERSDGRRYGYSGDFQWPMEEAIKCDVLVLDSTHGNPKIRRHYNQKEVETRLRELLVTKTKYAAVFLRGHTGCLQRALTIATGDINVPVFASAFSIREFEIYSKYGFPGWQIQSSSSASALKALEAGHGLFLLRMNEKPPVTSNPPICIMLSQYMSDPKNPVLEFSERDLRVAMSDHADFDGILDYVAATGAKSVITDNTRGGHAVELATAIQGGLRIRATPSDLTRSREWGRA